MTTIVTRAGKGSALSYTEMDANFNNLNNDKLEASDLSPYATTASVALAISNMLETTDIGGLVQAYSTNLDEYATVNPTPAGLALLDDADAAAQRTTLGLGTAATATLGTGSGQVPTADQIPGLVSQKQIQSISASVSANALTIGAGALSLDFRSSTPGSGTVTTVSGSPSNLVISSGSTLGTVSGQPSRIAVLAINNAGTIELAAVNIAGGNDLSETGLISTTAEGGAGAADSANVIYSTTARTNVAYRVIGYIESTQATAGTWATAPSTIQGAGGNALMSMQSIGYGQTWQTVTRTSGVTYYNTTGKPILILVDATGNAGSFASVSISVNGVSFGLVRSQNGVGVSYGVGVAVIPPNASYVLTDTSIAARTTVELR